jgi:hypothetical protein
MPHRLVLTAAVPATVLLLSVLGFAGRGTDNPVLTADVGLNDGFVITLTDASGAAVTHLDPGTYTLAVHDRSTFHNFHLLGPGLSSVTTDVAGVGDSTFTVTLVDGSYTFQCDPHARSGMQGTFTVGTPAPAPAPTATVEKLVAHVGSGAKVRVNGAVSLTAGPALITVVDTSRTENFHLIGPGVNKATGLVFKGTVTWKVTLGAGTYVFRSDHHRRTVGRFTVTSADSSGTTGYGGYNGGY